MSNETMIHCIHEEGPNGDTVGSVDLSKLNPASGVHIRVDHRHTLRRHGNRRLRAAHVGSAHRVHEPLHAPQGIATQIKGKETT